MMDFLDLKLYHPKIIKMFQKVKKFAYKIFEASVLKCEKYESPRHFLNNCAHN